MPDLCWPGDERAGPLLSDPALLAAMTSVEAAWLAALVASGIAPPGAAHPVTGLVGPDDVAEIAIGAESGGNPVIGLVKLLRGRLPEEPARWLHRGLTSQDVLDTALAIGLCDVADRLTAEHRAQVASLTGLVERYAGTVQVGRTLTQHAVPITFGLKAAGWLTGILDAAAALARARSGLAVQLGGAAGTMAAAVELSRLTGSLDPTATVTELVTATGSALGLPVRPPWHTVRTPFTALTDALVTCTDAYGHLAADVTTLSRPEIAELAEGSGGGSSTMPHKSNPVLSVLVRRAALSAPGLAATMHLAAASSVDERPDGAWHVEWATLRDLGRRTVVAASQTTELLAGLRIDTEAMAATVAGAVGLDAEQASMARLVAATPSPTYLGLSAAYTDAALARARAHLNEEEQ